MTAAVYARKSTDQGGVTDEQRSVARQVEHARAFAAARGWSVDEAHVYIDDGISGAEFDRRPAFLRLMNALKPRAPFQVLVMSEESRLGREAIETAYALKQLITAGVRVWFYLDARERTLETPTDKLLMSVTAFADEVEREKARQRTYDAMQRKAKAGHVTGGRVFGYDNVEQLDADGRRSHVVRRINQAEAAIVRDIFARCAAGDGLTRIAKALNAAGAPTPRPQQGRPAAWAPSSVREVLLRPLYRGEIVWNQTRKRDTWGQQRPQARSEADWLRVPAPELRLVDEALWTAAHARMSARRAAARIGTVLRPQRASRYLLAGFGRCASCGGSMVGHTRQHGGQRVGFFGCLSYWKKGRAICANGLAVPITTVERKVLETLRVDVLRPAVVERAISLALDALAPPPGDDEATRRRAREDVIRQLEAECQRLTEAVARGGQLEVLLQALTERQTRLDRTRAAAGPASSNGAPFDRQAIERALRRKLEDWQGLLARNVEAGREVLRALLVGPLTFTPVLDGRSRGYRFEGAVALERLVTGVVSLPTNVASPTGFEPVF